MNITKINVKEKREKARRIRRSFKNGIQKRKPKVMIIHKPVVWTNRVNTIKNKNLVENQTKRKKLKNLK